METIMEICNGDLLHCGLFIFSTNKMKNSSQSWYDKNVMCIINEPDGFNYKVQEPVNGQRRK